MTDSLPANTRILRLEDIDRPAPPERPSPLQDIALANIEQRRWTVVLDDDPTGTQTVANVSVVMEPWPSDALDETANAGATTFLLTNSRSLDRETAARLTAELVRRAVAVSRARGLELRVLSRSDSTLRGHFQGEVSAAQGALVEAGYRVQGVLFAPCFLEAGRYTAHNAQWVDQGDGLVNAAYTEYAKDATFGYEEPDLRDWVAARMGPGAVDVQCISLPEIRGKDGIEVVATKLRQAARDQVLIVNAVRPSDLEVVVVAIQQVEAEGDATLVRCGPSFVRVCAGQEPNPPLDFKRDTARSAAAHGKGLVVVGSHTGLTNRQLSMTATRKPVVILELDVEKVLSGYQSDVDREVARLGDLASDLLETDHVVIHTSRTVANGGRATPLAIATAIADSLTAAVERVLRDRRPRFVLAKGGITSSEIATKAFGASVATVIGQLLPGQIPLWILRNGLYPGIPYVVFPGNVGSDSALVEVLTRMGVPDV